MPPENRRHFLSARELFVYFSGFFGSLCSFFLSVVFQQSFHGQADTFLFEVDVSDLNLNFLTDGQNVLRFVDSLVGDLRNVDQTVNAWDDLSECTESSHGNNFSGNYAANFVISLENFPRIVLGFLVAQGDLFVFNVDVFYVYIQNVIILA